MSGYLTGVLVVLSFNIMAAYAVYLPLAAGQLNLGIAGFMAIGAYAAAYLTNELGWSLWTAIPAGSAAAGLVGLIIGIPVLRTHGIYLALATFALGQVIAAIFLNLDVVGAAAGYPVATYAAPPVVFAATAGVVLVMLLLSRTRYALYLTAVKSDPTVADLMGISVRGIQVSAFALGAAVAGFGGAFYAHHYSFIEAQHFNVLLSVFTVLYVLFGGVQTVWGPLAGAIFFTLVPEVLRASDQWRYALFAFFIIIFMALRPQGLVTASLFRVFRRKPGAAA
ncbi:branched-chain amino acid ABC transporter permease protein [Azorhizobium caulinodans ORS 571]|uniref:Branched-chain amino acid ABC transporter permease protein n=1 Tax=Azorhizobium caulinodans (strain ATCC 43989 / DSM 5975 / JCM 20966 / LMG 6465 / NBRC 14845 / NCIMB 13405 / ORS 571) TaxID=438753 RepID=A8IM38_AZOC5|nr:branched-chain amino acid ABC transporter permease [Azorhizobium caulinodans]BAF86478.1 branched-chain amino acid ABC transporter permease protein [Azorhizobium caulinodans ORS 571]